MAKAVNQNDLVEIIKAQVESLSDIMTVVFNNVNKTAKSSRNIEKDMKSFQKNVKAVFGKNGILDIVNSIKGLDNIKPIGWMTRKRVKRAVKSVIKLMDSINRMLPTAPMVKELILFRTTVKLINDSIALLAITFKIIKDIKTFMARRKINAMRKIFRPLQRLIRRVNRMRGLTKAMIKMIQIAIFVNSLKGVVLNLIILAPLLLILTVLSPLLIIGFLALVLVLKVMTLLMKFISIKTILMIMLLGMLMIVLCIIAMSLIVLGMLAIPLITMLPQIGLFFLGLVVILLLIAGVGWVMSLIMPMMVPFITGLVVLVILIAALWFVAWMLEQIAQIKLDDAKIKENIKKIIGCIFSIAEALFESSYEAGGASSEDNIFKKMFYGIIGFFSTYIGLLAAAHLLIISVVVVFLVFIIAHMLSWIQNINLKKHKIIRNVKIVMETAMGIVNMLFFGDVKRPKKAEESWYQPLLDYAVGIDVAAMELIGAILAVAYLAVMVVAIILILALAGMLLIIQNIKLQPKDINTQVKNVFDCCRAALDACMGIGQKTELEKSDKTFIGSLIEFAAEHHGGIFKTIINIVEGILAIAYVAIMVIAMLLILALAGILRALQEIVLEPEAINATIRNVFDCCRAALNACMGVGQKTDTEKSDKTWLGSFISWIGEQVGGIFKTMVNIVMAILAIAYVALMIVAMLLILALAGILRALQEIVLDPEAINATVRNVFDCCRAALNACMGIGQNSDTEESSNSFLGDLISWIGDQIGGIFKTMISILQAVLAIAYVAVMIVAMLLILTLASILRVLMEINLDPGTIRSNVETCLNTCSYINDLISGASSEKSDGGSDSWFSAILEWGASLVGNIGAIVSAIMNILYIALSIVNIFLIMILFKEMTLLNSVELDANRIKGNIHTVLSSANYVNDELANARARDKEKKKEEGLFGFLKNMFPGMAAIADFISNMAFLGAAIGSIGMIIVLAKSMTILSNINLNVQSIKKNVDIVIGCAKYVADIISNHAKANEDTDFDGVEDFRDMVEDIYAPMFNDIVVLCAQLKIINAITTGGVNRKQIIDNVKSSIGVAIDIAKYLSNIEFDPDKVLRNLFILERTADAVNKFGNVTNEGVENSRRVVDNYIRFIDKINSSDFQKLNIAAKIFESFARLSESIKGDFAELAESVNENIMPVLEETQELLKKLPAELEDVGTSLSSVIDKFSNKIDTSINNAVNNMNNVIDNVNNIQQTAVAQTPLMSDPNASWNWWNPGANTVANNTHFRPGNKKDKDYMNEKNSSYYQYESMQDIIDIMTGQVAWGNGMKVYTVSPP